MTLGNQHDVEGYLRSAGFNLLNTENGFVVADKPEVGGDRDTLLVWLPSQLYPGRPFGQFEAALLDKIEVETARYPNGRYTILVQTLEGISRTFHDTCSGLGVRIHVPVHFFDAPFRVEESPEAASAINTLRDASIIDRRVPQPFVQRVHGGMACTRFG